MKTSMKVQVEVHTVKEMVKARWGTLYAFAEFMDISHTTASNWVNRDPCKLIYYVTKLSHELNVSATEFTEFVLRNFDEIPDPTIEATSQERDNLVDAGDEDQ